MIFLSSAVCFNTIRDPKATRSDNDHGRPSGEVFMCFGSDLENCTTFHSEYQWDQSSRERDYEHEVFSNRCLWQTVWSTFYVMARNTLFWVFVLMVFQRLQLAVAIGYLHYHGHFGDVMSYFALILAAIFCIALKVVFQHVSFEDMGFVDENFYLLERENNYFHIIVGSRILVFQSLKGI